MTMPKSSKLQKARTSFARKFNDWAESPPLSVALVDIDDFKLINDKYGRDVGDEVLSKVHRALESLPSGSLIERLAGDEFVCAMPATSPEQALLAFENVRRSVDSTAFKIRKLTISLTLTAGIASYPQHTEDPADLINVADEALHRAKREGRNRAVIYVEDKMVLKSNYYPRAQLSRLARLSQATRRSEASFLREGLGELLEKYSANL
jgi:diguanylate cyclase (GGDEF)-like protein